MSAPLPQTPDVDTAVYDLTFLKNDKVSKQSYDGEIVPVLTSNENFDEDELRLLQTLNLTVTAPDQVMTGNVFHADLQDFAPPGDQKTLFIACDSKAQFVSLVRYIFRGEYTLTHPRLKTHDGQLDHDIFRSIRFHVDLALFAQKHEMARLFSQVKIKLLNELEYHCSQPYPPVDLVDTIPYIYDNIVDHADIIRRIAEYCVTNYERQCFDAREDFQELITENEDFNFQMRQAETKERIERGGSMPFLDIPLTKKAARERKLDAEIKLDDGEFWEHSEPVSHSSDQDDSENEDDGEDFPADDDEGDLLEALIVSAPNSLENSQESLPLPIRTKPKQPEVAVTAPEPTPESANDIDNDWELVEDT